MSILTRIFNSDIENNLPTTSPVLVTDGGLQMNRSNSTRARGKNQRGAKVTNNVPRQENKKPMPGAKESSVSDEEYDAGFKENKKRVARSPPEELQKRLLENWTRI